MELSSSDNSSLNSEPHYLLEKSVQTLSHKQLRKGRLNLQWIILFLSNMQQIGHAKQNPEVASREAQKECRFDLSIAEWHGDLARHWPSDGSVAPSIELGRHTKMQMLKTTTTTLQSSNISVSLSPIPLPLQSQSLWAQNSPTQMLFPIFSFFFFFFLTF